MRRLIWMVVFLMPALCLGQTTEQAWDNLKQLQVGQKIEVVQADMKYVKGTFLSVTDEALTLRAKDTEVAIRRSDVLRVSSREHPKRLRNALLGAGIGAAALGVPVAIFANIYGDFSESQAAAATALGFAIGAGAGAGIGAAVPSYETIYRAQKPRKGPAP